MGNTYCCGYQEKPGDDITFESKFTVDVFIIKFLIYLPYLLLNLSDPYNDNLFLEKTINIGLKFPTQRNGVEGDSQYGS